MKVTTLQRADISKAWGSLSIALHGAIARDPERSEDEVLAQLIEGSLSAHAVHHPHICGFVITQKDGADYWIIHAAGKGAGGPRLRAQAYRDVARYFEQVAAFSGCSALRIEGRNWAPILPDYHSARLSGGRFSLRKAL